MNRHGQPFFSSLESSQKKKTDSVRMFKQSAQDKRQPRSSKTSKKKSNVATRIESAYSLRTRARSVNEDDHPTLLSLRRLTNSELVQKIAGIPMEVDSDDRPLGADFTIEEYLWRIGSDRSLFEEHYDLEQDVTVRPDSPISAQLEEYASRNRTPEHLREIEMFGELGENRTVWIATLLRMRFLFQEIAQNPFVLPPQSNYAAFFDDQELLLWLIENNHDKIPNTTMMAAACGHDTCLQIATENGFEKHDETTLYAGAGGHLVCLKYATENDFERHRMTAANAANIGHLGCLKYATENGFVKNGGVTKYAAVRGHLDCLQYASENGYPRNKKTTQSAASAGHLDCLRYATENGFQKHAKTTMAAAANGHLDCLKYATENGFYKHHRTVYVARREGHVDCVAYARAHGYPDSAVADADETAPEIPSFLFPSEWNHFPMIRAVQVNVELPMQSFYATDLSVLTRKSLDRLFGETCYNAIEADNVSLQDFLEEDKRNHVVVLGPEVTSSSNNVIHMHRPVEAMTRDQLVNQKADLSAQFYPCVGRNGTFPVDEAVRFIKLPLSYNQYVPESDLDAMLSADHSSKQMWELTDSELDVGTMASGTAIVEQEYISAHHCQSGTGRRIYRLSAIDITILYHVQRQPTVVIDAPSSSLRRSRNSNHTNNNNNSQRSVKKPKRTRG